MVDNYLRAWLRWYRGLTAERYGTPAQKQLDAERQRTLDLVSTKQTAFMNTDLSENGRSLSHDDIVRIYGSEPEFQNAP